MTWIKICGTTNLTDAFLAVDAGADALGFVFYEKSPRSISPEAAREITAKLPEGIERVGVFVDRTFEFMQDVAARAGLTAVQLHATRSTGNPVEPPQATHLKNYLVLPAEHFLPADGEFELLAAGLAKQASGRRFHAIFLDSGTSTEPGGTGKTFDWQRAKQTARVMGDSGFRLVVAGGLTPDNVSDAIHILKPWGVDVVSGVETTPGKKNSEKVRAFIHTVRQSEKIG